MPNPNVVCAAADSGNVVDCYIPYFSVLWNSNSDFSTLCYIFYSLLYFIYTPLTF